MSAMEIYVRANFRHRVTKLDGTAKGGVIIGISDQFRIPVRYIGIGEGIDQLKIFDRQEFVNALFGE